MLTLIMPECRAIFDRNLLYAEVWAEPMRNVAERYGVSGVALAKTCRKLAVPVPGRGYWARAKAGKVDAKPPLPPLKEGQPDRIVTVRREPSPPKEPPRGIENAVPVTLAGPVVVPAVLENPHRLVQLSTRYLRRAHPKDGIVSAPTQSCLNIRVAPASLDRALRISDALIKAMEAAGLFVEIAVVESTETAARTYRGVGEENPRPPERTTRVVCDNEWIEFSLSEHVRRVLDAGPSGPADRHRTWEPRAYTYVPTGELALHVTNANELGICTKWRDGKHQRLEEMLEAFVENLATVALAFKLKREDDEHRAIAAREAELRRYEEEQRRYEQAERRREEKKRQEDLEAEVASWRRAQDIRDYVMAAMNALEQTDGSSRDEQLPPDRLRWALAYADKIDPLRRPGGQEGYFVVSTDPQTTL